MSAPTSRPPPIAILVAVTATGPLALNILMPSMPALPAVFGTDYATVQLTLSLYLGSLAGAQLIYGPLSDRYGRRPVLLGGLGIFLLGTIIGALAGSISMVIVGRVLQAIGGCAGMVLGRAIVRDLFERDRSASVIAYVTMAMVVAPFAQLDSIAILVRQLVMWVYLLVSPTPGSSGVAEWLLGAFFAPWFALSSSLIAPAMTMLIWRMATHFIYLLAGVLVIPGWLRRTRRTT